MGELDGEDGPRGPDDIGDVRDGRPGRGAEIQDFCAGADEDLVEAAEDAGCELASEGIPDSVFGFGGRGDVAVDGIGVCGGGGFDGDAFLAVDGFAG